MVLPGHIAGGYLATTFILGLSSTPFTTTELAIIYVVGILAGEIPDLDLLFFYFNKKNNGTSKKATHRDYITHLPMFWLSLGMTLFLYGYSLNSPLVMTLALVLVAGTFSHFILDSIEYGIQWFKPLSHRRICLFEIKDIADFEKKSTHNHVRTGSLLFYWNYVRTIYVRQISFYAELLVVIIALVVFFWN